jgi:erythromycin esterase-like protein
MAIAKQSLVASEVKKALHALRGDARDYDPLLKLIHGARFCLLGEATHGTHEFYRERAEITKRLIKEQGFTAVAVEADWPDAFRVNRYVRGLGDDRNANEALGGFKRFPTWMWRNTVVLDFVECRVRSRSLFKSAGSEVKDAGPGSIKESSSGLMACSP